MRSARNRSIDRPLDAHAATQVFCPTISLPVFAVKSDQAVLLPPRTSPLGNPRGEARSGVHEWIATREIP
jgi:hypothetical protein